MYFIWVDCDFQSTITIDFFFYLGSMWNITFAKLYIIPYLTFDVIAIIRQNNVCFFFTCKFTNSKQKVNFLILQINILFII